MESQLVGKNIFFYESYMGLKSHLISSLNANLLAEKRLKKKKQPAPMSIRSEVK